MDLDIEDPEYPSPSSSDLKDPLFEAIWRSIRTWDLARNPSEDRQTLYAGATGNDAMRILREVRKVLDAKSLNRDLVPESVVAMEKMIWAFKFADYHRNGDPIAAAIYADQSVLSFRKLWNGSALPEFLPVVDRWITR
jgi:hypothetical protein